jgi:AraC family transcriptional regulator, melibiose operon regulatory protein
MGAGAVVGAMSRGGAYLEQGSVFLDGRSLRPTHRHNHIEMNVVEGGSLAYRFGGSWLELLPEHSMLFWAGVPHQLVDADPEAVLRWVHVPLRAVLGWPMGSILPQLLGGDALVMGPAQGALLTASDVTRWQRFIAAGTPDATHDAWAEIERSFRDIGELVGHARPGGAIDESGDPSRVEAMLLYIADHYGEALRIPDIGIAGGLAPDDAARAFRRKVGFTIDEYVLEFRLRHAAALMTSGDDGVETVAREAGFGTLRLFDAAFRSRFCTSPDSFRKAARARTAP